MTELESSAIGVAGAAIGLGACVVATAGFCGAVAAGTAAANAVASVAQARYRGYSWARSLGSGVVSYGTDIVAGRLTKSIKAVRWFGKNRNYRKISTALRKAAGRKRLVGNIWKSSVQYFSGQFA